MTMNLIDLKERIAIAVSPHDLLNPLFTPEERDFLLDLINGSPQGMVASGEAVLDNSKNHLRRIDHLWAALSTDEDGEGLCAAPIQRGMLSVPLIAADRARLDSLRPIIKQLTTMTNRTIRIVKFTKREEIGDITP